MSSQLKTGAVLGYANIIIKNIINLLYTPMLLVFIGQNEFGVYQTAYQFMISLQLFSFGFSAAYIRFYTKSKVQNDAKGINVLNGMYLVIYLVACVIVLVVGFLLSGCSNYIFSSTFSDSEIALIQVLLVVMTINMAVMLFSIVFDGYIIAHERFVFQQTRQIAAAVLAPVLAFCLLLLGLGAPGVALAQLISNFLLLVLNIVYSKRKLSMKFDFSSFDKALLKALIFFSSWLFVNQITDLAVLNLPSVILGATIGASGVAVFSIAVQLRSLFFSLSTTLSNLFIPRINRVVAQTHNNWELTELVSKIGRYQGIMICWVLGGFIILGPCFIDVWAGNAFRDAYWLTLIMVVPFIVPLIQNAGIEIQRAKNKHKARSISYLLCAIVDLAITLLLADTLGYWAAAIGCVCYTLLGPIFFMNWYNHKVIGLDMLYFWKKMMPIFFGCCLSTVICYVGTLFLPINSIAAFILWGFVFSLLYFIIMVNIVLDKNERYILIGKMKRMPF